MKDKPSKIAGKLLGRWRIIELGGFERSDIDLVEPGFIRFSGTKHGDFAFVAVHGWLDCQAVEYEGMPGVEFSWEGNDEGDLVHGRGWARLVGDNEIEGRIYFHLGDDLAFRAHPYDRFAQREH